MKRLGLILMVFACSWAWAATYYVDATGGDDGALGTSDTTPWKTLSKVNGETFSGDDQVLLKAGEMWRETLVPPSAGTSGHPIVFGRYGTGADPKIYGSTEIPTWADQGGNSWTATHVWSDTAHMQADGTPYPGPYVMWRDGAMLTKVADTPDAEGEWGYSGSTLTIYTTTDPNGSDLELATRDNGIYTAFDDGANYLTVEHIEVAYTGWCGIFQGHGNTFWTVDSCTVHDVGTPGTHDEHGINSRSHDMTVSNCTVYNIGSNGINYSDSESGDGDNFVITGNTVYDCHHAMINLLHVGAETMTGNEILRNVVYLSDGFVDGANSPVGIYFGQGGGTSTVCAYNLVYQTTGPGISVETEAVTCLVENNTIYGGGTASIFTKTAGGLTVRNNIAVNIGDSTHYCYRDTTDADNTVDYNDWYSTGAADGLFLNKHDVPYAPTSGARTFATWKTDTGDDAHSIITDPGITNVVLHDFSLTSSSGAKDTGTNLAYATDLIGTAVPQNTTADMGAYEYTETIAPTVTVEQGGSQTDPINSLPIVFDVTFSEVVTGFDETDVTMGGTATGATVTVDGSGTDYHINVTAVSGDDGTLISSIAADKCVDIYNNGNEASTSTDNSVTYDSTNPTVTVEQGGSQADPATSLPVVFDITFDEQVTGFDTSDITMGGTAVGVTYAVTGSGAAYTLTVSDVTVDGTLIPTIAGSVCTDLAGNDNDASSSTDGTVTFAAAQTYTAPVAAPVKSSAKYIGHVASFTGPGSAEIIQMMAPVEFKEEFLGYQWLYTETGSAGLWYTTQTSLNTSIGLLPDKPNGLLVLNLDSDNNAEQAVLYWGNQKGIDVAYQAYFQAVLALHTVPTTGVDVVWGMAGDHSTTRDNIAQNAWFRCQASGAVVCESDDGTTDLDDKATGITMAADMYHVFQIDFTSLANVKFYIDGTQVATTTTFDLSDLGDAEAVLQPYIGLGKASGTGVGCMYLDSVRIWSGRD